MRSVRCLVRVAAVGAAMTLSAAVAPVLAVAQQSATSAAVAVQPARQSTMVLSKLVTAPHAQR